MSCQEINDLGFAGTFDFFYLPLLGPIKRGVAMLYHISCKLTKKHSFRNTQHIIRRISTRIKSIHWIISWNSIVRVYHVHILPTLIERSGDFLVSLGRREKNIKKSLKHYRSLATSNPPVIANPKTLKDGRAQPQQRWLCLYQFSASR